MAERTTEYNDAEEVTLYEVGIEGRGGDSVCNVYFETEEAAIFASALDGQDRTPREISAFKLSNGSYIRRPIPLHVGRAPSEADIAKLMEALTPVQKLLLARGK